MKIKHTIYVLLLAFTLVPLYAFGFFMVSENDKNVEKIAEENLAALSGAELLNIKNFCDATKEKLEVLAGLNIVHNLINASLDGSYQATRLEVDYLENMLMERKNINTFTESLSIIDRDFNIVMSTDAVGSGGKSDLQYADPKYLSGDFYLSNVTSYEVKDRKKQVVAAVQGIFDGDKLIGYVVEEIKLSFFDKIRTETNLWKDGTLYLIDGNDQLITAGNGIGESRKQFVTNSEERKNYTEAWANIDKDKEPSGKITYQIYGVDYITYYSRVEETNWTLMLTISLSALVKDGKAYRFLMMITILIMSVLYMSISYFASVRLSGPIDRIVATLKKIRQEQDYSLRVKSRGKNEIAVLTEEINNLLSYIEQENLLEKEQQRQLKRKAERDPLTGVRNKKAIEEKLQDMIQTARETESYMALAFVDVDDFKAYNTKYGHQKGDRVLQFVVSVLEEYTHGEVGRIGGDEFVLGILDADRKDILDEMLNQVVKALNEGLSDKDSSKNIPVPCSIGMVVASGKSLVYSQMIHQADEAMYLAKRKGKNGYHIKALT